MYLYPSTQTDFTWNGEPIRHAYDKHVIRDDTWYLKFKLMLDKSEEYKQVKRDMIVYANTPDGAQPFRVLDVTEHDGYVEVFAPHVFYDISNYQIGPLNVNRGPLSAPLTAFGNYLKDTPFTFSTSISDSRTFNTDADEQGQLFNALEVLLDGAHSLVGTWEAELLINGFDIRLVPSVGTRTNALLYEKKNISSFENEESNKTLVTRIFAFSKFRPERKDGETEAPDEIELSVTVDSPLINEYATPHEKKYINNDMKTVTDLKNWAQRKFTFEKIDLPKRSIKVGTNIIDGTVINYGDYLVLKYLAHDIDEEIRCVGYDYEPDEETFYDVTLGSEVTTVGESFRSNVQDLTEQQINNQIEKTVDRVTRIVMSSNMINRMAFGPSPVPNPRQDDLWFEYQFSTPNDVTVKQWDDTQKMWVIIMDDFMGKRIQENLDALYKTIQDMDSDFDKLTADSNAALAEMRNIINNFDGSNQEMIYNIIGENGKWLYSDNRMFILGQDTTDTTSDEMVLKLEDGRIDITHNGEGFSIGNDYALSWVYAGFVERPKSTVTLNLEVV